MIELFEILILARRVTVPGELQVPIPGDPAAPAFRHQDVARRKLLDGAVDRVWRRNVKKREVRIERLGAPVARHVWILKQRLDLRAEDDADARDFGVVQRLYAEPVAGEKQPAAVRVPHREREHAAEPVHASLAPLFIP